MDDAEERLKTVMTPEFDRRIKDLMIAAKAKNVVRSVSKAVEEAIADLYDAFAGYSMSDPIDYCDHCVSADEVAEIRRTPLRDLTSDHLWTISSNIVLTFGGLTDFKFFLPRLIESSRLGASYYIETIFTRFRNTEFDTWPDPERESVANYVRRQFEENVVSPIEQLGGPMEMDALLCCAYYAGILPEILGRWTSDTREIARRQLLEWVLSGFGLPDDPYAFMDGPPASVKPVNAYYDALGREALLAWLKTSEVQEALSEGHALDADLPTERRGRLGRIMSAARVN